ncbi:hypothetical protein RIF29_26331 [Crotalaria pallida]|uniref:Uncharacterized protein n=1 Tax=Crotalaria pallida TaxID=3830 RepID=A0AAN9ESL0_CROPI
MPKKRGRPLKNKSQSFSKQHGSPIRDTLDPQTFDILQMDEEDLVEIDNLSPKQVEVWLKNLEVLRDRIKGKSIAGVENNGKPRENNPSSSFGDPNFGSQPTTSEPARPNENVETTMQAVDSVIKELSVNHDIGMEKQKEQNTKLQGSQLSVKEKQKDHSTEMPWTVVKTRSKAQIRIMEQRGEVSQSYPNG